MLARMTRAEAAQRRTQAVEARARSQRFHRLANQRRLELAITAEVVASIEAICETICGEAVKKATEAGKSSVQVDVYCHRHSEEVLSVAAWEKGTRCKVVLRHLVPYLLREGFSVFEGQQYFHWNRGEFRQPCTGLWCIPLTLSW